MGGGLPCTFTEQVFDEVSLTYPPPPVRTYVRPGDCLIAREFIYISLSVNSPYLGANWDIIVTIWLILGVWLIRGVCFFFCLLYERVFILGGYQSRRRLCPRP
jgi:hypothetical protein